MDGVGAEGFARLALFGALSVALYAGHWVGDYWVQTDVQAREKGAQGPLGVAHCVAHVGSYVLTQIACVWIMVLVLVPGFGVAWWQTLAGFGVSGVTHYLADRREHGLMIWLARRLCLARLLELGVPRKPQEIELWGPCSECGGRGTSNDPSTSGRCWDCRGGGMLPGRVVLTDNPSLGTGGWALDQAWHIFWGVFVTALILAF